MSTPMASEAHDANDADFQQTVIDASHEVPVLVDFWAPWCEPCKVLGPVLEKLAGEYQGRFKLVKVNMDENPMLSQALMIRSIPAVKLIVDGAIKDEFMGAYPEPEVRAFLDKNLSSEGTEKSADGLQLLIMGDRAGALGSFQTTLAENPKDAVALIGMGTLALDEGNLEQARQCLENVNEMELDDLPDKTLPQGALQALRARVFLLENSGLGNGAPEAEGGPGQDISGRFTTACRKALEGAFEDALQGFFGIVQENRKFKDDGGRLGMLAVFDLLPPDSELAHSFRSKLSSFLFS